MENWVLKETQFSPVNRQAWHYIAIKFVVGWMLQRKRLRWNSEYQTFVKDWCLRKEEESSRTENKRTEMWLQQSLSQPSGSWLPPGVIPGQLRWLIFHHHLPQLPNGNGLWKSETPEDLTAGMCLCSPRSWVTRHASQGHLGDVFLCLPHFWKNLTKWFLKFNWKNKQTRRANNFLKKKNNEEGFALPGMKTF